MFHVKHSSAAAVLAHPMIEGLDLVAAAVLTSHSASANRSVLLANEDRRGPLIGLSNCRPWGTFRISDGVRINRHDDRSLAPPVDNAGGVALTRFTVSIRVARPNHSA